jgi:hypothetical protein
VRLSIYMLQSRLVERVANIVGESSGVAWLVLAVSHVALHSSDDVGVEDFGAIVARVELPLLVPKMFL